MRALNIGGLGCGSEDRGKGNGRERKMRDGGKMEGERNVEERREKNTNNTHFTCLRSFEIIS